MWITCISCQYFVKSLRIPFKNWLFLSRRLLFAILSTRDERFVWCYSLIFLFQLELRHSIKFQSTPPLRCSDTARLQSASTEVRGQRMRSQISYENNWRAQLVRLEISMNWERLMWVQLFGFGHRLLLFRLNVIALQKLLLDFCWSAAFDAVSKIVDAGTRLKVNFGLNLPRKWYFTSSLWSYASQLWKAQGIRATAVICRVAFYKAISLFSWCFKGFFKLAKNFMFALALVREARFNSKGSPSYCIGIV